MSNFKNNPAFNLYYSDTDSAVIDKPLDAELVGKNLGQMKLEYTIEQAVFLAPKVYGFITTNKQEITAPPWLRQKIKGFVNTSVLHLKDLEDLLVKNQQAILEHKKIRRNLLEGRNLGGAWAEPGRSLGGASNLKIWF
jgi:hypothetical protein